VVGLPSRQVAGTSGCRYHQAGGLVVLLDMLDVFTKLLAGRFNDFQVVDFVWNRTLATNIEWRWLLPAEEDDGLLRDVSKSELVQDVRILVSQIGDRNVRRLELVDDLTGDLARLRDLVGSYCRRLVSAARSSGSTMNLAQWFERRRAAKSSAPIRQIRKHDLVGLLRLRLFGSGCDKTVTTPSILPVVQSRIWLG
jgi:hypothetical protein